VTSKAVSIAINLVFAISFPLEKNAMNVDALNDQYDRLWNHSIVKLSCLAINFDKNNNVEKSI
jgi:hypothetical protein